MCKERKKERDSFCKFCSFIEPWLVKTQIRSSKEIFLSCCKRGNNSAKVSSMKVIMHEIYFPRSSHQLILKPIRQPGR